MKLFLVAAMLSLVSLLPVPAAAVKARVAKCAAGETSVRGKCVKACATEGSFGDPDACECPSGYGKILLGSGNGQCSRLRCPTNAEIPAGKDCDCPQNYEKRKTAKGKVRCEVQQAQAK